VKPTFAIVTLGCKTNQFESAAMAEQLVSAGYLQHDFNAGADLVLINTCTVTAKTDTQSRKLIRRARRYNPRSRVVVTGCYAQVDAESLARLPGVDLVLGNQEKHHLLKQLTSLDHGPRIVVSDLRAATSEVAMQVDCDAQRSRAFLQIQNGCDAFCSYCIIPYARGASRSVMPAQVSEQVQRLVSAGYQELVLTGIHIGQYGHDLSSPFDLLKLLHQIVPQLAGARLRVGSLEPTELSDDLLHYLSRNPQICPHYHIPLQSGNNRILQQMNRSYSCCFFSQLLHRIRRCQPHAGLGTDLIVGFPGETDDDFEQTYKFVQSLPLSYIHVFPYSRRPGTPAAQMIGQVSPEIAKIRAARIRQLGAEKLREFSLNFVGQQLEIIAEPGQETAWMQSVADNYLNVKIDYDPRLIGRRVLVDITNYTAEGLHGKVLDVR
jgi:threonylcarbamoyladenosine tRNA methylthiotransferase MtaB